MIDSDNGLIFLDSLEIELFPQETFLTHYSTEVFLVLLDDDSVTLRVFDVDTQDSSTEKLYDIQTFTGTQEDPDIHIPYLPSTGYRVTLQQNGTVETQIVSDLTDCQDVAVTPSFIYAASTADDEVNQYDLDGTNPVVPFGDMDSATGGLNYPWSIIQDSLGNFFIVSAGGANTPNAGKVVKFTSAGVLSIAELNSETTINRPRGIAIDSSNRVYVAVRDTAASGTGFIRRWDNDGGNPTNIITGLDTPNGVTIDDDDNIYVSELGEDLISKYDSNGVFISDLITGILGTITAIRFLAPNFLYLQDAQNGNMNVYDIDTGDLIANFLPDGTTSTAVGFDFDAAGIVYNTDRGNNGTVIKYPGKRLITWKTVSATPT